MKKNNSYLIQKKFESFDPKGSLGALDERKKLGKVTSLGPRPHIFQTNLILTKETVWEGSSAGLGDDDDAEKNPEALLRLVNCEFLHYCGSLLAVFIQARPPTP